MPFRGRRNRARIFDRCVRSITKIRIGPVDPFGGQRRFGIVMGAWRCDFDVCYTRENTLGGGAAQPVLAAHEQIPLYAP